MFSAISNTWNRLTNTTKDYISAALVGCGGLALWAANSAARVIADRSFKPANTTLTNNLIFSVAAVAFTGLGIAVYLNNKHEKALAKKDIELKKIIDSHKLQIGSKENLIEALRSDMTSMASDKIALQERNAQLSIELEKLQNGVVPALQNQEKLINEQEETIQKLREENSELKSQIDETDAGLSELIKKNEQDIELIEVTSTNTTQLEKLTNKTSNLMKE